VRALAGPAALGLVSAALVTWVFGLLPLSPNVVASTLPWQVGCSFGLLAALGLASRTRPALRPLLILLGIAFGVAALCVDAALLAVSQFEMPLRDGGGCKSSYYRSGGVCVANALHRSHFSRWIPVLSGLGLATWVVAYFVERKRGLRTQTFTAILLGLALGACTLQNANYLNASLSFEGDRVRAWNVFHYYLGSKYYKELGHQDIYAAVLAADDDYQERVILKGGSKKKKRLKRSWSRVTEARDLRTYKVLPREELVANFDRSKFTDERLRQLGKDSRFLKKYMGFGHPGWQDCFKDLGFNPAPPWTVIGTPLSNIVPTKWPWFWLISNSDLLFYLLVFGLVWWAFGLRTLALMTLWLNCAQLNEARFTGGFLQYDWLVSCLATIAFYRKGWYRSAGVALSWGAMTRVFPGFLILPIGMKVVSALVGFGATEEASSAKGPLHRGLLGRIHRAHWNFCLAFGLACAVLFSASCITGRGFQNWSDWYEKIENHSVTHPVTSDQRIGVGRLAVHQPRPLRKNARDVSLLERVTAPNNKHRFWSTVRGNDKRDKVLKSQPRKHFLQLLALPFLLLALVRRKDVDGMILMLFGVFLLVTVSRYYAATWAMLFALGAASQAIPPARRLIATPALFIGGVLLAINSLFYAPGRVTTSYYVLNYLMYAAFLALCIGYLVKDARELLADRRTRSDKPSV